MFRVIHFEIPADDPERAVKFYQQLFGWKIQKWEGPIPYWLIETGDANQPGINGAIMIRERMTGAVNTIDVPSVDEYASKVTEAGGKALSPKVVIPGVGYFAYCSDPEGNPFGIIENDASAK